MIFFLLTVQHSLDSQLIQFWLQVTVVRGIANSKSLVSIFVLFFMPFVHTSYIQNVFQKQQQKRKFLVPRLCHNGFYFFFQDHVIIKKKMKIAIQFLNSFCHMSR